ncbi:MAG: hypothetical protein WGN25_17515 [Candidatus Electrothrix sp. GW3-4]|uniref:two-CW domain-containing protein n=1 Tax=Candidatus Electrothrix sp. GW3-4 TaxID=3126740 RepID=UPI0030CB1568
MRENFLNCWEVKDCGREPNGKNVPLHGVCPVSVDFLVDGIHNGKNGGRCCWAFAPGVTKESYDISSYYEKALGCLGCEFYKSVKDTTVLLVRL